MSSAPLRDLAAHLLRAALKAVEPRAAVRRALLLEGDVLRVGEEEIALGSVERVRVVGAGKAACAMAQGALDVLGPRIAGGTLTTRAGYARPVPGMEVWEAAHPLPDTHGLAGAGEALHLARGAGERDLLLCLLSGGASALWPAPPPGVSLGELREVTQALLRAGARIGELNTVRKHLSHLAGGQLARAAHPARVLSLILSDVVGSPLEVIASGPTVPDPTTFREALAVLARYGIRPPPGVLRHLQAGAAREAERLELEPTLVTDALEGEAREVAREIVAHALRVRGELRPGSAPAALLWGGETTVTVRGDGMGGRNQELALAAATLLEGEEGILLAVLGTDGIDGPTDAAGGVVDGGTVGRGREQGLDAEDHLARNDAYSFLQAAGDLLVTGPTGTNVNDVVLALVSAEAKSEERETGSEQSPLSRKRERGSGGEGR